MPAQRRATRAGRPDPARPQAGSTPASPLPDRTRSAAVSASGRAHRPPARRAAPRGAAYIRTTARGTLAPARRARDTPAMELRKIRDILGDQAALLEHRSQTIPASML